MKHVWVFAWRWKLLGNDHHGDALDARECCSGRSGHIPSFSSRCAAASHEELVHGRGRAISICDHAKFEQTQCNRWWLPGCWAGRRTTVVEPKRTPECISCSFWYETVDRHARVLRKARALNWRLGRAPEVCHTLLLGLSSSYAIRANSRTQYANVQV